MNKQLFDFYKTMIRIRKENSELSTGEYMTLLTDDAAGTFAYKRFSGEGTSIVAFNNDSEARKISIENQEGEYENLLTGAKLSSKGQLSFDLPAKSATVLKKASNTP